MRTAIQTVILVLAATLLTPCQAAQSPEKLVQDTAEELLAKIRDQREVIEKDPGKISALVESIVIPHFDFERMAQWVLGKYWRQADSNQRQRFVTEFRELLIRTYASSLAEYADRQITFSPLQAKAEDNDVTVHSEVQQPGGFPIPVDYDLYLGPDGWKVYDVSIDGVSLVMNYRTSFSNEIRQKGIDTLIKDLAERNRQSAAQ